MHAISLRALIIRHRLQSVRSFMFAHIFCPIWRTLAVASRAGHASMCPSRTHAGRAAAAAFYLSICCRRAVPTCFVESRCQPSLSRLWLVYAVAFLIAVVLLLRNIRGGCACKCVLTDQRKICQNSTKNTNWLKTYNTFAQSIEWIPDEDFGKITDHSFNCN